MNIEIAINTAPRPVETLKDTVASLRRAGFDQTVHIISDGPDQVLDNNVVIIKNDPPLGALANFFFALDYLCEKDADWYMILEDDIVWAEKSQLALEQDLIYLAKKDNVGYLSVYMHKKMGKVLKNRRQTKSGLYTINLGYNCIGSQAYILSSKAARHLASNPEYRLWHRNQNRDRVISGRLQDLGYNLYYRMPGLVNHSLGSANSAIKEKTPDNTTFWQAVAQARGKL
jgi:GR25 family glycosyltransferase involved in LPS biosynthesis